MKKLLAIAAATLLLLPALARERRGISDVFVKEEKAAATQAVAVRQAPKKRTAADTFYCEGSTSHYGWLTPTTPMTARDAAPFLLNIALTDKNSRGHYTRAEILRDGNLFAGAMTFTANDLLNKITPDAGELQAKIARTDYISDPSGKRVLQERFYDTSGGLVAYNNLVYDTDSTNTEYIHNAFGMPLQTIEAPDAAYGIQIRNTFDSLGRVKRSDFVCKGKKVTLDNGLDHVLTVFSADGLIDTLIYIGADDKPMAQRGNYAARVRKRHHRDGQHYSTSYLDANLTRVNLDTAFHSQQLHGVCEVVEKFAPNFLTIESRFYDADGNPVENTLGTHRIAAEFKGNYRMSQHGHTLDGRPSPIYESDSRCREDIVLDRHNRLRRVINTAVAPGSRDSLIPLEITDFDYDDDNKLIHHLVTAYSTDGKKTITYEFRDRPDESYWQYNDGSSTTERYDKQKRIVKASYRMPDGSPDSTRYSTITYKYSGKPGKVVTTKEHYDRMGTLRLREITDSAAFATTRIQYDTTGVVCDMSRLVYTPGFTRRLLQQSINADGKIVRNGTQETIYYTVVPEETPDGKYFTRLKVLDEFGEPDFTFSKYLNVYSTATYYRNDNDIVTSYHDDDQGSYIVGNFLYFNTSYPKLISIEVTDPKAYELGLKDNDIVLGYGSYRATPYVKYHDVRGLWELALVLEKTRSKEITVFRIESTDPPRYGLKTMTLPAGSPSELGFVPHVGFKTRRQMERISEAAEKAGKTGLLSAFSPEYDKIDGTHKMIATNYNTYFTDRVENRAKLSEPAVFLSVSAPDIPGLWYYPDSVVAGHNVIFNFSLLNNNKTAGPIKVRHTFTTDGKTVDTLDSDGSGIFYTEVTVPDSVYELLKPLIPQKPAQSFADYVATLDLDQRKKRDEAIMFSERLNFSSFYNEAASLDSALLAHGDFSAYDRFTRKALYGNGVPKSEKEARRIAGEALGKNWPKAFDAIADYYKQDNTDRSDDIYRLNKEVFEAGSSLDIHHLAPYIDKLAATDSLTAVATLVKAIEQYCWFYVSDGEDLALMQKMVDSLGPRYNRAKGLARVYRVLNNGYRFLLPDSTATLLHEAYALFGEKSTGMPMTDAMIYNALSIYPVHKALLDEFMADKAVALMVSDDGPAQSPAREKGMKGIYYMLSYNNWNIDSPQSWHSYRKEEKPGNGVVTELMQNGKVRQYRFADRLGAYVVVVPISDKDKKKLLEEWQKRKK